MRRNIFLGLFILIVSFTINAHAQEYGYRFYVRGDSGVFIPANEFKDVGDDSDYISKKPKNGTIYNVGLGYVISDHWRSDLNFNYRILEYKAKKDAGIGIVITNGISQKVKIYSVLLNGYYDLNIHKVIKPYLIVGMGYSHNNSSSAIPTTDGDIDDELPGTKKNNFVWNIGIGTKFILNDRFSLDVSYRYIDLGKTTTKDSRTTTLEGASQKITSHDIMGGVTIHL